jgi:hypothetical protein
VDEGMDILRWKPSGLINRMLLWRKREEKNKEEEKVLLAESN